jgi:glycosyltransferase involved in cell wall biosynthesis
MARAYDALVISRPATRRLLLVAYYFPPQPKGGAHRLGHIAKHLPEFGWDVTVVTPAPDQKKASLKNDRARLSTSFYGLMRELLRQTPPLKRAASYLVEFLKLSRTLRNFPDSTVWWVRPALAQIRTLLKHESFDAILTTHSPCSGHLIGAQVALRHGIPWLADYQDLWTYNGSSTKSPMRKSIEKRVERRALVHASAITCCKESFVGRLRELQLSRNRREPQLIPFAVDLDLWKTIPDVPPHNFCISFFGNMYPKHITPDLLFGALAKLLRAGNPAALAAQFHYYGHSGDIVRATASKYNIQQCVFVHGVVSRLSALEAQRASALLVSIVNPDSDAPNPRVWFPSKLFEYAGANRRILAIAPQGSIQQQFIQESGLGYFACDEEHCADAIIRAHTAYTAERSSITPNPTWQFSTPREIAQKFAAILNSIVTREPPLSQAVAQQQPAADVSDHLLPSLTGAS